jgi:hypothetical protein
VVLGENEMEEGVPFGLSPAETTRGKIEVCGYFGKEGRRHALEEQAIGRGGSIEKVGQEVGGCVPQGRMS